MSQTQTQLAQRSSQQPWTSMTVWQALDLECDDIDETLESEQKQEICEERDILIDSEMTVWHALDLVISPPEIEWESDKDGQIETMDSWRRRVRWFVMQYPMQGLQKGVIERWNSEFLTKDECLRFLSKIRDNFVTYSKWRGISRETPLVELRQKVKYELLFEMKYAFTKQAGRISARKKRKYDYKNKMLCV